MVYELTDICAIRKSLQAKGWHLWVHRDEICADRSLMGTPSNEPIRLTERQTEMLTRALAEAAQEAATPKASETEILKKSVAKPVRPVDKPPKLATTI